MSAYMAPSSTAVMEGRFSPMLRSILHLVNLQPSSLQTVQTLSENLLAGNSVSSEEILSSVWLIQHLITSGVFEIFRYANLISIGLGVSSTARIPQPDLDRARSTWQRSGCWASVRLGRQQTRGELILLQLTDNDNVSCGRKTSFSLCLILTQSKAKCFEFEVELKYYISRRIL